VRNILKSNTSFLFPYLIFVVFGGLLLAINSKVDIHLTFNSFHLPIFDTFFFYTTYLGDGVVALLTVIILLAVKYRYALIVGLSNLVATMITQILKHSLFAGELRPKKYFEGIHDIYLVPGVENLLYNSFPSGHTTCAFALYFSLSLIVKNKTLKLTFFIIALLVGYSRIYLSQHFFSDVYAGSLIGVVTTLLIYVAIRNIQSDRFENSLITSL
jgi:membrane-associated phospholipid phosphatase